MFSTLNKPLLFESSSTLFPPALFLHLAQGTCRNSGDELDGTCDDQCVGRVACSLTRRCFFADPPPCSASTTGVGRLPPTLHSLHVLIRRWCGQMLAPPHSLHWLLMRWCGQMLGSSICPHHRQKSTCKECGVGGQATRARRRGGGGRCIGKETATCQASSDPAAALIDTRDQLLFSDKVVALAVASLSLLQPSSKLGVISRSLGEISSLC